MSNCNAPVEFEVLCFDLDLVVSAPVEAEGLVDEEGAVHGPNKQLLGGGQTLALGDPDVEGDPCLRQQPQQPDPGMLVGNEVLSQQILSPLVYSIALSFAYSS